MKMVTGKEAKGSKFIKKNNEFLNTLVKKRRFQVQDDKDTAKEERGSEFTNRIVF